jgi:hypothetical protein
MRRIIVMLTALALVSCGGGSSPAAPSGTSEASGSSSAVLGLAVSALDGAPLSNISVTTGPFHSTTSDSGGLFQIGVSGAGTYRIGLSGNAIVDRETSVATGSRVRVSLIPAGFDLTSFDEMARANNARLERWTTRPALVILGTIMQYRSSGSDTYDATGEQLTDEEIALMTAHLTEGLGLLSGNAYESFATVSVERPAAGTQVNVFRTGTIVVGRYTGIENFRRTIGYGQWATEADGRVVGGAMFLDRDFDRGDSRRRLLRIHELGHALGYQHVQTTPSIMRPTIGPEPTDFDRAAALIAYQRPVGNRAPDIDPAASSRAVSTGGIRWSDPTVCR